MSKGSLGILVANDLINQPRPVGMPQVSEMDSTST
jgi:hypothetical protein